MFSGKIWLLIILCSSVNSSKQTYSIHKNTFAGVQAKSNLLQKEEQDRTTVPASKNGGTGTNETRSKRGIVMVDSDFDIPSDIYTYENNLNGGGEFGKIEGSGTDELDEKEPLTTKKYDIKRESEPQMVTNRTTSFEFHEKEPNFSTKGEIRQESEQAMVTNRTTFLAKSSTKALELTKAESKIEIVTDDPDGSGDGMVLTEETTNMTTKSREQLEDGVQETIPDACMTNTCTEDDVLIFFSEEKPIIPAGTNFTLTCMNNGTDSNMLQWYKNNGSEYFLQTFSTKVELKFNVPDAELFHSGVYLCTKWADKHTCCHRQLNVKVYEVPLYKYHLMIVGLIALAALLLCIFLTVRRSRALKSYTKQFAEKHGNLKHQLI